MMLEGCCGFLPLLIRSLEWGPWLRTQISFHESNNGLSTNPEPPAMCSHVCYGLEWHNFQAGMIKLFRSQT